MTTNALISQVRKLDVQTEEKIANLAAKTVYFPGAIGVASHFLFNSGAGDATETVSGNTGTVTGAEWGSDEDGIFLNFISGKGTDLVDFGTSTSYHSGITTVGTWEIIFKPRSLVDGLGVLFEKGNGSIFTGTDFTVRMEVEADAEPRGRGHRDGASPPWSVAGLLSAGDAVSLGALHHLRMTFDTGASPIQSLFLDDMSTTIDTVSTGTGNLSNTTAQELIFGASGNSPVPNNFFDGRIYEAKIWKVIKDSQVLPLVLPT